MSYNAQIVGGDEMTEQELSALFAYNLNRMMAERGLKQADIIKSLGVGKATVSDWCSGTNVPRTPMFSALINTLGAKASDFFREKDPTPVSESGMSDSLDTQLANIIRHLTPKNKKKLTEQLEFLLYFQEQSPDSQE